MLAAARRRILLIDHSKLGKVALHCLAPLREFERVVVDAGVGGDPLRELREAGVPVDLAPLQAPAEDGEGAGGGA
jgi:DeoR/GlpR family transcriptional regulator of sugar metabolism